MVATSSVFPLDPTMLDFANLFLSKEPFARTEAVDGEFHDGSMSFAPDLALDFVVGYSLGNNWRVETSLATSTFDASTVTFAPGFSDFTLGSYTSDDVWLWISLPFSAKTNEPGSIGPAADTLGVINYSSRADFLLVSGWYDIETDSGFTPYVGGGIGLARLASTASFDCGCAGPVDVASAGTRIVPAAQLGGGIRVKLAEPVTLDFGYRYRVAANAGLGFDHVGRAYVATNAILPTLTSIHESGPISVHALTAGLTFAFN